MIAALPMYDRPETRAAHDRLWARIAQHLPDAPQDLTRGADLWETWTAPDLLLSQTCGMPFRERLSDRVAYVATPVLDLDLPPGCYASVLVARREDPRTTLPDFASARFAYNDPLSQSGWSAPQTDARDAGTAFGTLVETGAHRASAQAVAEGQADIAGIDMVTWGLICQFDAWAAGLHVIARTAPTPALPYITAADHDPAPIRAALSQAIADIGPEDRALLCLRGITEIPLSRYLDLRETAVGPGPNAENLGIAPRHPA